MMEAVLDQKDLGIASRLRRAKGRPSRTRSIASRFTPDEEKELTAAATANGRFTAEWAREVCTALLSARDGGTEAVFLGMDCGRVDRFH
jgi:hypothetical protein